MKVIDTSYILNTYNQIDIFSIFLSYIQNSTITKNDIVNCINTNIAIESPLRVDNNPSVGFYYNKITPTIRSNTDYSMYGKLYMRDFTASRFSISNRFWGDCFDLVRYMLAMSNINIKDLSKLAEIIDIEMQNTTFKPISINKIISSNDRKVISILPRESNIYDSRIWSKWGLNGIDLREGLVYPVEKAWINYHIDTKPKYKHDKNNPCYCYYFGVGNDGVDNMTLYLPNNPDRKRRFITNHRVMQGINTLKPCDILIITKSYKDTLLIRKLISLYLLGSSIKIDSISVPAENYIFTPDYVSKLKSKYGISDIFILFDNDMPGKRYTIKVLKDIDEFIPLLIPTMYGEKDLTDLQCNKNQEIMNEVVTNFINTYL